VKIGSDSLDYFAACLILPTEGRISLFNELQILRRGIVSPSQSRGLGSEYQAGITRLIAVSGEKWRDLKKHGQPIE
jgi:hypothetical protein